MHVYEIKAYQRHPTHETKSYGLVGGVSCSPRSFMMMIREQSTEWYWEWKLRCMTQMNILGGVILRVKIA